MVVLCLRAAMNLHCCFAVEANFFLPPAKHCVQDVDVAVRG